MREPVIGASEDPSAAALAQEFQTSPCCPASWHFVSSYTRDPPTQPSMLLALYRPWGDDTPRSASTLSTPTPGLSQVHPYAEGPRAPDLVGQPGRRVLFLVQGKPRRKQVVLYLSLKTLQLGLELARELDIGVSIWEMGQCLDSFYDMQ